MLALNCVSVFAVEVWSLAQGCLSVLLLCNSSHSLNALVLFYEFYSVLPLPVVHDLVNLHLLASGKGVSCSLFARIIFYFELPGCCNMVARVTVSFSEQFSQRPVDKLRCSSEDLKESCCFRDLDYGYSDIGRATPEQNLSFSSFIVQNCAITKSNLIE